jgi:hypothetical protein
MAASALDRCGYCGHDRAAHNRPEAGNPAPSLRCARGCICAAFIEADGRPDWQHYPGYYLREKADQR